MSRELNVADQTKSISVIINDLQAAIEHHVEDSLCRSETIEMCLAQVDRLGQRLREQFDRGGAPHDRGQSPHDAKAVTRLRVGSPRLAEPERAIDFTMDVTEEL